MEGIHAPSPCTNGPPTLMSVTEQQVIRARRELEPAHGTDETRDDGEVLGHAEMRTPAEGVEKDDGEDTGLGEDEGEEDDDITLAAVGAHGVVERGRAGNVERVWRL